MPLAVTLKITEDSVFPYPEAIKVFDRHAVHLFDVAILGELIDRRDDIHPLLFFKF